MFIQTEPTPNPASVKFMPGVEVLAAGGADFSSAQAATVSPLARRLFEVSGVTGVYLGADSITVTKADDVEWHHLKPALLGAIMEHFATGLAVMDDGHGAAANMAADVAGGADGEIVARIVELLETRVRPAVAMDGGDVVFHRYDRGVVYLHMQGACAGCPSSTATLKYGIENLLRHYIPDVSEVRPVLPVKA